MKETTPKVYNKKQLKNWKREDLLKLLKKHISEDLYQTVSTLSTDTLESYFLDIQYYPDENSFGRKVYGGFRVPHELSVEEMKSFDEWICYERAYQEQNRIEFVNEYIKTENSVSYIYFTVDEFTGTKRRPRWEEFDGKGILYGKYCYVVSYDGMLPYRRKNIYAKHFYYDKNKVYKRKPRDFDKERTDAILKEYRLGKYAKKRKLIEDNPLLNVKEVNYMTIAKLNFDKNDKEVGKRIYEIVNAWLNDPKKRKVLNSLLKKSNTTNDFVYNLINCKDFKESESYWDLIKTAESSSSFSYDFQSIIWYKIRSIFGNKRFYTEADAGAVKIGNNDFSILISNQMGDGRTRVAVLDEIEDAEGVKLLNKLMVYTTVCEGKYYIYDYDCGNDPSCELNGRYAIYVYQGLVAFVKTHHEEQYITDYDEDETTTK